MTSSVENPSKKVLCILIPVLSLVALSYMIFIWSGADLGLYLNIVSPYAAKIMVATGFHAGTVFLGIALIVVMAVFFPAAYQYMFKIGSLRQRWTGHALVTFIAIVAILANYILYNVPESVFVSFAQLIR